MVKLQLVPTEEQRAIIFGSLLGDGTLQKREDYESYRLRISYSTTQKAYVFWMYEKLKSLCVDMQPPKIVENNKFYKYEFYLRSGDYLKEFYDLFFRISKKTGEPARCITQELIEALPMHPMVLAVWYMDDGSRRSECYSVTYGCNTRF